MSASHPTTIAIQASGVTSSLAQALMASLQSPASTAPLGAAQTTTSGPAIENPAVAHCCNAHADAVKAAREQRLNSYSASQATCAAYRQALPPLCGQENIRNFIACVAHGILIDAIGDSTGARLLYAAQVASAHASAESRAQRNNDLRAKKQKRGAPSPS
jgi:hypothetical protein